MVARLGGDEFAIVQMCGDAPDADAAALADRIVELISAPFEIRGHHFSIGASVGIALAPLDGIVADDLVKKADLALYQSKSHGRGNYGFFEAAMGAVAQARQVMISELRMALVRREFVLHYQPIRDLKTGEIVCLEALLRWQHPLRGMILPDEFLPLAEDCGLIVPIGDWVMRTACGEAMRWPADVRVSVNLLPSQFSDPRLVSAVATALMTSGLQPQRLELDINEMALLQEGGAARDTLRALQKLGVRLSMDNFGAAHVWLGASDDVLFDRIKIDRHFIEEASHHDDALVALAALTGLGKRIARSATATGVETTEQLDLMRAAGCAEIQGLVFEPPRPAAEIRRMLKHDERRIVA
jgi:predicted signal transduction protein with EAL and GGDEF domain